LAQGFSPLAHPEKWLESEKEHTPNLSNMSGQALSRGEYIAQSSPPTLRVNLLLSVVKKSFGVWLKKENRPVAHRGGYHSKNESHKNENTKTKTRKLSSFKSRKEMVTRNY
jgi:hypothetical protein